MNPNEPYQPWERSGQSAEQPYGFGEGAGEPISHQPSGHQPEKHPAPAAPEPKDGPIKVISLVLSAVFSPLLVPTYACALAFWTTYLSGVPEQARFVVSIIIFGITGALPMGVIIYLMRRGVVGDSAISNRKERTIPFLLTTICYLLAFLFLGYVGVPSWLSIFFAGASVLTLIAVFINQTWKISAHGMVMGGLCAMVAYIGLRHIETVSILPWLTVVVICAGLVGSARLYLHRHTPGQVYAGLALGFVVELLAMFIF